MKEEIKSFLGCLLLILLFILGNVPASAMEVEEDSDSNLGSSGASAESGSEELTSDGESGEPLQKKRKISSSIKSFLDEVHSSPGYAYEVLCYLEKANLLNSEEDEDSQEDEDSGENDYSEEDIESDNQPHPNTNHNNQILAVIPSDVWGIILGYCLPQNYLTLNLTCIFLQNITYSEMTEMPFLLELRDTRRYNFRFFIILDNFQNLRKLNLKNNLLVTDKQISRLTNLTDLNLSRNENITDSVVKTLTNLYRLNLTANDKISDESLGHLKNLTELTASENISGECLINLPKLQKLTFYSYQVYPESTCDFLEKLKNLTSLNLFSPVCGFRELDPTLSQLTNLTELFLFSQYYVTPTSIQYLTNLRTLGIRRCSNLSHSLNLIKLVCLETLEIDDDSRCYNDWFFDLPNLTKLTLPKGDEVTDNNNLLRLTNLKTLILAKEQISLQTISQMTNLTCLGFEIQLYYNTRYRDYMIPNLANLTHLTVLKDRIPSDNHAYEDSLSNLQ